MSDMTVPMSVADDPAYKYGLLLGALDEVIARWSDMEAGDWRGPELPGLLLALSDLREVVRIHG